MRGTDRNIRQRPDPRALILRVPRLLRVMARSGQDDAGGSMRRWSRPRCGTWMRRGWRGRTGGRRAGSSRCRRRRWRARGDGDARPSPAIARVLARVATASRLDEAGHRRAVRRARARTSRPSAGRPTHCAPSASATPSPTSSTATSTTPTSAPTAASSAPSPRAGTTSAIATSPTISTWPRSRRARRKPGSAAPPRCACRAASSPATPATPISPSSRR